MQHSCRFGFAQTDEVSARDHVAISFRERLNRCEDGSAALGDEDRLLGGWGRTRRGTVLGRAQGQTRATPRAAPGIASLVGDDSEQPRPECRVFSKPWQGSPRLYERLLDNVIGVIAACHHVRHANGDVLIARHQLVIRTKVARACPPDQFRVIVQWTALH
jgi:hypothetical protein